MATRPGPAPDPAAGSHASPTSRGGPVPAGPGTVTALTEALERLAAGTPARTDGRLTVTNLAREAGVSRSTAHRVPELIAALRLLAARHRAAATRRAARVTDGLIRGPDPPVAPVTGRSSLRITRTTAGLAVDGDVDPDTVGSLRRAVADLVTTDTGDAHLDLAGTAFIDLYGLRLLTEVAADLSRQHRRLVLENLAGHLRRILQLTGWDTTPGLVLAGGGLR